MGFPGGTSGKGSACQCRRCKSCKFYPWVFKMDEVMATHSNILARRIPWTEEPYGLQSIGWQKSQTQLKLLNIHVWLQEQIHFLPSGSEVNNLPANAGDTGSIHVSEISPRGGNGNPLQQSLLGNPMNRGAWAGNSPWVPSVGHNWACMHASFITQLLVLSFGLGLPLPVGHPPVPVPPTTPRQERTILVAYWGSLTLSGWGEGGVH